MVADALLYHPDVSRYLKYMATTVGRDKLLRTLQYFARFLAWYLLRTDHPAATIAPFTAVKKQFAIARKLLRVGKFVEPLQAAARAMDRRAMDPVLRCCAVGRHLGLTGYLFGDNLTVLDSASIKKFQASTRVQRIANRCWFTGISFSIVASVYELYQLRERARKVDVKQGEGAAQLKTLQRESAALRLQLLIDACDLTIPASALKWADLDDGVVGLAGTLSSLLGMYSVWKKSG